MSRELIGAICIAAGMGIAWIVVIVQGIAALVRRAKRKHKEREDKGKWM